MSSETTSSRIRTLDIPQANSLGLILDTLALIEQGIRGKERLGSELRIAEREADYYAHATRILGLIEGRLARATVTEMGQDILNTIGVEERGELLSRAIRNTEVMSRLLQVVRPEELSIRTISEFLLTYTSLTGATVSRRANTILAWSKPVLEHDPESIGERAVAAARGASQAFSGYQAGRNGGEGDLHRRLKEAVANAPENYLGEPMTLIQVEFPFPTNDRADILFEDTEHHLVAVEVKVDVGPTDTPGLLQAAKYKVMLAILFRLPVNSVRGILLGRTIHVAVKRRAEQYGIETFEVHDFE